MTEIVFVKLGGSLITDKARPETVRGEVLGRLAGEIAEVAGARPGGLVVGHGSGSFGHVVAERFRVHEGVAADGDLEGIARTQDLAARLHRIVVAALLEAGALPFGFAPSSALVTAGGRPAAVEAETLARALGLGLLPVVYGDVVLDRERGCAICSTETLFEALAGSLRSRGFEVARMLWLGETDGIYDARGRTIPRVTPETAAAALGAAEGSAATDVTGGMRHRLETALRLAASGITSWILDGRRPGVLADAVRGEGSGGTRVGAG